MKMLRKFWRNETGSIPIEGIYASLLLLGWLAVAFQISDAFRTRLLASQASYAVGDLISREQNAIGPTYVTGLKKVFDFITHVPNSNYTWMRVTLVSCSAVSNTDNCDGTTKIFSLVSSYSTAESNGIHKHTQATINLDADRIPVMAAGDMAVIVETSMRYYPIFGIGDRAFRTGGSTAFTTMGLSERLRFSNFVVTRPRGPRTVWDDAK
ncbi:hypothetical protein C8J30_10720 [Rhodobacter viridis]|uniref:Flp pilus assembly protein TadG n=1 Tax=Rhodobacter viridis TaxID=1054202 RepID=A0A318U5G3_9RHOB|nr:hypothetical protein [Rhodobacter viridis]PYF09650.1 hypothetical protein C8J30_10720 [Rhodobacter viridis]